MCTLKNYPYKIEHTIQWSRDVFEGLFTQSVQTLASYRDDTTGNWWISCRISVVSRRAREA